MTLASKPLGLRNPFLDIKFEFIYNNINNINNNFEKLKDQFFFYTVGDLHLRTLKMS
jgi:hypothetical protein